MCRLGAEKLMVDWTPAPSAPSGMVGVSMLWGDGGLGNEEDDSARVASFQALTTSPAYIIGFEEPDCSTTGSADMTVEAGKRLFVRFPNELTRQRPLLGTR
jgi:hypothetical protein